MSDYIAYHSTKVMGHEYIVPKDGHFYWWSGKSEIFLRSTIGSRAWAITSRLDGRRSVYRLAGVFTPSELQPESGGYAILGDGTLFQPSFDVTSLRRFSDLRREQTNFSFGFSRIRNEIIVTELERETRLIDMPVKGVKPYFAQLSGEFLCVPPRMKTVVQCVPIPRLQPRVAM
jgi:hypothetical protein